MAFSQELRKETISFGDLTVTKVYDGRDLINGPTWAIELSQGDELLSRIVGAGFENHAISPRGSVLVGISNTGYPDTAYIVIDKSGKLMLFRRHPLDMEMYCDLSVSAIRKWYDDESPDVTFTDVGSVEAEFVTEFNMLGCSGERVSVKIR